MNAGRLARLVAAAGLTLAALSGCGRSPVTRFYDLTAVATGADAPSAFAGPGSSARRPSVGIRSVALPHVLDRPQIVTRTGANTVAFAEFDRWSAPLAERVAQVLAENLSVRLGSDRIVVYPWPPRTVVDHEVIVEVTRFDGVLGHACALETRWRIVNRAGPESTISGRSGLSEPAGADYASLVAAQSRLIDALANDIAAGIRHSSILMQGDAVKGAGR